MGLEGAPKARHAAKIENPIPPTPPIAKNQPLSVGFLPFLPGIDADSMPNLASITSVNLEYPPDISGHHLMTVAQAQYIAAKTGGHLRPQ